MNRHLTNLVSQKFGRFAGHAFPAWFQHVVNRSYVRLMGLDMGEFNPPESYPTLNALFTRRLVRARSFSGNERDLISPADSLVTAEGRIVDGVKLQIKGMRYNVDALLGAHIDAGAKASLEGGRYINLYLSPSDYHRYHIPTDLQVLKAVHIPGKLYPVNFPSLRKRPNLFIENERVVIECLTRLHKRLYIVLVGALNVGKMQVAFEPRIQTNADALQPTCYTFEELFLKKGDDFGCFEMGSTIVLLGEKGAMRSGISVNQKVRFGETIATLGS